MSDVWPSSGCSMRPPLPRCSAPPASPCGRWFWGCIAAAMGGSRSSRWLHLCRTPPPDPR
eukprot:6276533-Lingulodinium_polyedra.AAC.1